MAKLKLKISNVFTYLSTLVFGLFSPQHIIAQEEPSTAGEEASKEASW